MTSSACVVLLFRLGKGVRGRRATYLDVFRAGEGVVGFVLAEGVAVDVGGEVAYCGGDAGIEGTAVGEVAAETHA